MATIPGQASRHNKRAARNEKETAGPVAEAGVIGALVAIPIAAPVLLILREITFRRLDEAQAAFRSYFGSVEKRRTGRQRLVIPRSSRAATTKAVIRSSYRRKARRWSAGSTPPVAVLPIRCPPA